MQIRILSITAQGGGESFVIRAELCEDVFDAEPAREPSREIRELSLLADCYVELRPTRGVIDETAYLVLEDAAAFSDAVRMGLRMLAFGANTKRGLESKLVRKGVPREVAGRAALHLASRGYISETEDAVREAEINVRKLRGRNRIRALLYEKGYDADAVSAAERYLDEVDFSEVCARLIERRYGAMLEEPESRKRMAATLMRNGFSMNEIRAAVRALSAE